MMTTTKYSPEVRERAVRLVLEHQDDHQPEWAAKGFVYVAFVIEVLVAVGMAVTCHPPHRSVRAELPHTAPASGS